MKATQEQERLLAAGRYIAVMKVPYLASLLYAMVPVPCADVPTIGITARGVLLWNPDWIGSLKAERVAGLWLHEAGHLFGDDAARRGTRDPIRWNIACDMKINAMVRDAGLELPDGGFFAETYGLPRGLTAEEFYERLPADLSQQQGKNNKGKGGDPLAPPQCGSGAGNKLDAEDGMDATAANDAQRSNAELHRARKTVAEEIKKRGSSRLPGNSDGFFSQHLDEILGGAKVRWEAVLSKYVRGLCGLRAGSVMTTFAFASRKQGAVGGYGPGRPVFAALRAPMPNVVLGLDTSGSMFGEDLEVAVREADGLLKTLNASVSAMACDTRITAEGHARTAKQLLPLLKGGGGTSFVPFFEKLRKGKRPDCLIIITDGWGTFPREAPNYPVVWLLVGGSPQDAPFGKCIRVQK